MGCLEQVRLFFEDKEKEQYEALPEYSLKLASYKDDIDRRSLSHHVTIVPCERDLNNAYISGRFIKSLFSANDEELNQIDFVLSNACNPDRFPPQIHLLSFQKAVEQLYRIEYCDPENTLISGIDPITKDPVSLDETSLDMIYFYYAVLLGNEENLFIRSTRKTVGFNRYFLKRRASEATKLFRSKGILYQDYSHLFDYCEDIVAYRKSLNRHHPRSDTAIEINHDCQALFKRIMECPVEDLSNLESELLKKPEKAVKSYIELSI